jgi:phage/plasmid-associated DNA primase
MNKQEKKSIEGYDCESIEQGTTAMLQPISNSTSATTGEQSQASSQNDEQESVRSTHDSKETTNVQQHTKCTDLRSDRQKRNVLKHTSCPIERTSIVHYCKRVLCPTKPKHILRLNERPYEQDVYGIEKEYRSRHTL